MAVGVYIWVCVGDCVTALCVTALYELDGLISQPPPLSSPLLPSPPLSSPLLPSPPLSFAPLPSSPPLLSPPLPSTPLTSHPQVDRLRQLTSTSDLETKALSAALSHLRDDLTHHTLLATQHTLSTTAKLTQLEALVPSTPPGAPTVSVVATELATVRADVAGWTLQTEGKISALTERLEQLVVGLQVEGAWATKAAVPAPAPAPAPAAVVTAPATGAGAGSNDGAGTGTDEDTALAVAGLSTQIDLVNTTVTDQQTSLLILTSHLDRTDAKVCEITTALAKINVKSMQAADEVREAAAKANMAQAMATEHESTIDSLQRKLTELTAATAAAMATATAATDAATAATATATEAAVAATAAATAAETAAESAAVTLSRKDSDSSYPYLAEKSAIQSAVPLSHDDNDDDEGGILTGGRGSGGVGGVGGVVGGGGGGLDTVRVTAKELAAAVQDLKDLREGQSALEQVCGVVWCGVLWCGVLCCAVLCCVVLCCVVLWGGGGGVCCAVGWCD